jgi:hypothetical protein
MPATFALARTPMYDSKGNMARQWVLYFAALGGGTSGVQTIANVGNTFTPDLSQGPIQYVLLVADSILNAPINEPDDARWRLIIDQDAAGGHNLTIDPAYFYNANLLGTAGKSTRAQSDWTADAAGNNSLAGTPSTDQPIPA